MKTILLFSITVVFTPIQFNSCTKDRSLKIPEFSLEKQFEIGVLDGDDKLLAKGAGKSIDSLPVQP